jgi:hypothetical protein
MELGTIHQLAYLTPDRMVSWKCLSLQASDSQPSNKFAPVAYASRSTLFFSEFVNQGKLQANNDPPDAVLWVFSCPKFKLKGGGKIAFPPTLTSKIVIDEVVTGDVIRAWVNGNDIDLDLDPPPGEGEEFQDWRQAVFVNDSHQRAIFRITRDFARYVWKKKKGNPKYTQLEAWASVRTAIANPNSSMFLAHTDATACLSKIFGRPDLADLPMDERSREFAWQLLSPRKLPDNNEPLVSILEDLVEAGNKNTIFMSYRWKKRMKDVAHIGLRPVGVNILFA